MIIPGNRYGDVRKQASRDQDPHGLTPNTVEQLRDRFEQFLPGLSETYGQASKQFFNGLLPEGAELTPRRQSKQANFPGGMVNFSGGGGLGGGGGGTSITPQRPYQPEFESPDRQQYPVHRILANRYWRLFYKLDPVIGNCVDMYCMPAGEKVMTPTGMSNIEDIRPGDMVLSSSGIPQETILGGSRKYNGDIFKIRGVGLLPFTITEDHRVKVFDRKKIIDKTSGGHGRYEPSGDAKFIPAKELKVNDYYLVVPKLQNNNSEIIFDLAEWMTPTAKMKISDIYKITENNIISKVQHKSQDIKVNRYIKMCDDLAELFGWYAAEGSKTRHRLEFSFHKDETAYAERVSELVCKIFGINPSSICWYFTKNNGLRITICNTIISSLFSMCGESANSKLVPECIMSGSKSWKMHFIAAYLRGDGCLEDNTSSIKANTVSEMLARQIQLISSSLDIFFNLTYVDRSHHLKKYGVNRQDVYNLTGNKKDIYPKILDLPYDQNNMQTGVRELENYYLTPIKSIEVDEFNGMVYDIKTPDESFCLPAIVHNSTMPFSDFQLTGEGVTGDIKEMMETMCMETNVLRILEYMVKEFLVIGEACPHNFFDESKGIWTYTALHNPDQLEVIDAPFIKMDPVVEFIPDDRLRAVLTSNNHLLRSVRDQMPPELISRLIARQNIPLSPINMTFIPRKMHPYDTRGTSIISRMWRILMYEDSQPPGTPITRPDGTNTPIEQLVIGDSIVGKIGNVQEITNISEKYAEKLINIKIQGGWSIQCTAGHKWPVFTEDNLDESIKTQAADIKLGDYLSIPRQFELSELDKHSNAVMARLLGYYIAEGSKATFNKDGYGVAWALNANEVDTWAKDIENLCLEVGCDTKTYVHKSGCMVRSHKNAQRWLADWLFVHGGQHAATKQLSQMVMGWPLELKEEFIRGYFRGDGSLNANHNNTTNVTTRHSSQKLIRAATISYNLAYQIQLILAQLGIFVKIRSYQPPNNDGRNRQQIYYIEAYSHFADILGEIVWGTKQKRIITDNRAKSNIVVTDTHILLPVIEISVQEYDGLVYSLETSGDHSYQNANIATYNSIYNASISTARRHAGPIKVAKLGNPQTGWIPSQEHEKRLLQLLAQAELDVNAWLVYHYGINFELVGTTDRIMNINQHHEVIERIKLIAMGISKCFVYDTPILMSDGRYKSIQNINIGDKVIDKNGYTQTVKDAWCEGVPEKLTDVTVLGKTTLTTTPNHKYPVYRNESWYKLRADEIKIGDFLSIPRNFEESFEDVSKDQARLLGYYISDGYVIKGKKFGGKSNGDGVSFTFGMDERDTWVKDILEIGDKINVGFTAWPQEKRNSINIGTQKSKDIWIASWLQEHGGEYAPTKLLSSTVMRWSLDLKKELIKGLYRGDGNITVASSGSIRKDGTFRRQLRVRYTTVSYDLARQIQLLLAQIGIYARLKLVDLSKHGVSKRIQSHLNVTGPDAYKLLDMVWGNTDKADIGIDKPSGTKNKSILTEENLLVPVIKTNTYMNNKNIPVYNLSVSGSHSYLAYNFSTFNSFLHGEVTYASSITGLSVFLQRMKSLRNFFVHSWLIPKFFKPIAQINGWVKRDKKELTYRYRIKRSQKEIEMENRWILPKIEWEKQLDANINSELVTAMNSLEQMGVQFSKTTKYAAVGRKFEEEVRKIKEEQKFEQELNKYAPPQPQAGGPGGPGGGMPPGPKPGGPGAPSPTGAPGAPGAPGAGGGGMPTSPGGGNIPNAPGGAGASPGGGAEADKTSEGGGSGPSGKRDPAEVDTDSAIWDHKGRAGNWSASEVTELSNLLREGHTNSPLWADLDSNELRKALNHGDVWEVMELVEEHLRSEGYPSSDITQLKKILDREGVLRDIADGETLHLQKIEEGMSDEMTNLNDKDAMERLSAQIEGYTPEVTKMGNSEALFIGHGNATNNWSGDVSGIIGDE